MMLDEEEYPITYAAFEALTAPGEDPLDAICIEASMLTTIAAALAAYDDPNGWSDEFGDSEMTRAGAVLEGLIAAGLIDPSSFTYSTETHSAVAAAQQAATA